ncbi:MAG: efflux RND transporter periplasmic adaptor subunit [Verrucomicrobia bacterium]|nr:efflux RND transporter periplasmic adaptor subunit [Verrucomicrobiota bacterium]
MNKKNVLLVVLVLICGFVIGRACSRPASQPSTIIHQPSSSVRFWTCSMHPQIHQPEPGQCPLCGMDLVPVSADSGENLDARELTLSHSARKLAGVELAPVERRFVSRDIRMVGKVEYDETRLSYLSAWVPGRIDRLFVDYTGVPVRKGDHMVQLYSPALVSAQEELIQAVRAVREQSADAAGFMKNSLEGNMLSAREKLSLLGLTDTQISEIEKSSSPSDEVTIYAPINGIVVHKNAVEGMYVDTGTRIYTVADISQLWIKLDAYESDLSWLRYGQNVSFETESYPGEPFTGVVSFIDPMLDSKTRTAKVRVIVPNSDGRLKPGMFVRAVVKSSLAKDGRVMNPDLAGKWISPMHPEVVKDGPGQCDVCGMDLVRAEELGFVTSDNMDAPIVIPATAPLITGKRAVVYVTTEKEGVFEGREIVLGPRAGDCFIVKSGLSEGELVVSHGNFKIDSAIQIMAGPSMMNPGRADHPGANPSKDAYVASVPEAFLSQLTAVVDAYINIGAALSSDDAKKAEIAAGSLLDALTHVDMSILKTDPHKLWMPLQTKIRNAAEVISDVTDIQSQREGFRSLSSAVTEAVQTFGTGKRSIYRAWCPMAFNNTGAHWLQNHEEVLNPYFGSSMLHCGEIQGQVDH